MTPPRLRLWHGRPKKSVREALRERLEEEGWIPPDDGRAAREAAAPHQAETKREEAQR